ncbi:uncharacterized protein LOC133883896 isoform X2 [Phragmites australis]|uniref:uncharacterized protein LOC133883896 isoform X2 n=1 Tax=Phragmites australis TaxID=29695 RepID=UPI002D77C555|nr:uncharacterized protein LOC133883896 isoform X2 [Phragmites australis]
MILKRVLILIIWRRRLGEKEEKILDGSNDDEKGDGCLREDTLESIKGRLSALEQDTHHKYTSIDGRIQVIEDRTRCLPELHAILQRIVKLLDGSNRPTTCEETGRRNREKNKDTGERGNSRVNNEKPEKPCREPATDHKRTYSSGTSNCDQSNIFGGVKRKIDLVSSPTLVEKVKTRRDRQPSKVCKSPYEGIKRNRIFGTKTDGDHVDEVTQGLALSDLELAAIKFVQKELAQSADKVLVRIGISDLRCSLLRCLIRPVRENGADKWLDSEIITSYASIFNSIWEKEPKKLKHAVSAYHSDWLRCIGKDWMKTGLFCKKVVDFTRTFCQSFVGSDMVFIPINTTNTHWWLCVLCSSKKEFQILDPYSRRINYAEESKDLRSGIHSILQAVRSSPPKLESRWSNYDILNWDVVVVKNIPRQLDACSCGIFTIKYMQFWDGSKLTCDFSQEDMETFRKKMPAELLFSPFNDLKSIKDDVLAMADS